MSGAPEPRVPIARMRDAVRDAVDATSLRVVADAVERSEGWVRRFLAGAEPQARTREKLEIWYGQRLRERADAALGALVEDFPKRERGKVRESVRDLLRDAHRKLGSDPPAWLADD